MIFRNGFLLSGQIPEDTVYGPFIILSKCLSILEFTKEFGEEKDLQQLKDIIRGRSSQCLDKSQKKTLKITYF